MSTAEEGDGDGNGDVDGDKPENEPQLGQASFDGDAALDTWHSARDNFHLISTQFI